jgi:transformation/transcription domain-associated protein
LATDFRKGFFRHVDALLEERLLLHHPRHYSTTTDQQAILLPLGYSTLADLVHHVRSILSLGQLGRVVHMFSRVLHDDALNLPMTIQITAVRLLLNVVDIIFNNKDPNGQIGRDLLDRILDTLVRKLGSLRETVTDVQQASKLHSNTDELESEHPSDKPLSCGEDQAKDETVDRKKSLDNPGRHKEKETMSVDNWMLEGAKEGESLQDVQSIVRSIIVGLKTVVWCITNYRVPKDKDKPSRGDSQGAGSAEEGIPSTVRLTKVELDLIENYIEYAIPCMGILSPGEESRKPNRRDGKFPPPPTAAEQQQMDVLNYFAACFTVLDGFHLRNTLGKKIDLLVETVVKDSSYMVIPRHLLGSNHRTSFEFCEVLLPYLVGSVERLAVPDAVGFVFLEKDPNACQSKDEEKRKTSGKEAIKQLESMTTEEKDNRDRVAATILELFERVMKSLSSFPENEEALRPHLQTIVSSSLQLSMEKRVGWPDRLCTLLRFVFRSVSAGKFEESYREILPMIPTILNGLFRIFQATEDDALHHVFIELCLTIPARLSSLLPHIPLLMRIIVHSLESRKGELVNLG